MTYLNSLIIEINPKNQSLMNQLFSWEYLTFLKPGTASDHYFAATINKFVRTHKYQCNEEINSVKLTSCYDEFYMMKLNCSFPWIKTRNNNMEKCGSNRYVQELVDLIKNATDKNHSVSKEIDDFGCNVPNCINTKWQETKTQKNQKGSSNTSVVYLYFPVSSKVNDKFVFLDYLIV